MARARKTFDVEVLKNRVNQLLLDSADEKRGQRLGAALMLEGILHDTGNYKGFGYLDSGRMSESAFGDSVGIDRLQDDPFEGTDNSRVYYY